VRSAPRNIAEGFGRYDPREFARYLRIARASLMETRNHLNDPGAGTILPPAVCAQALPLASSALRVTDALLTRVLKRRDPTR
jgi:hypothetical protein